MILPFKQQFESSILSGTKIHTIRDDIHERWEKGRTIQFATGLRTKNYKQFKSGLCTGVQDIFMTYTHILEVSVDGRQLFDYSEREQLARNDGFETLQAFEQWFIPFIKAAPKECYSGKLIHWTDFRY